MLRKVGNIMINYTILRSKSQGYCVLKRCNGFWQQISKPYKTKRQACIRMNMLALGCDYKTAIRIYNEDIGIL